jgi:hypothetical protein
MGRFVIQRIVVRIRRGLIAVEVKEARLPHHQAPIVKMELRDSALPVVLKGEEDECLGLLQ